MKNKTIVLYIKLYITKRHELSHSGRLVGKDSLTARSIRLFSIQESKAKEKRKGGKELVARGRSYTVTCGHMTDLRTVGAFPWPGPGNRTCYELGPQHLGPRQ